MSTWRWTGAQVARRLQEKPSPNAVWVGERQIDRDVGITTSRETYFPTRHAGTDYVRRRLVDLTRGNRRVLIGFDFAYGYPDGFAEACRLEGSDRPWRLVWNELQDLIEDGSDNANNRFAVASALNARIAGLLPGPFWGCPVGVLESHLEPKGAKYPYRSGAGHLLACKRETENVLPKTHPTWKLWGAGSVGGQTLVGIPAVARLRGDPDLRNVSRIWPFETGFTLEPTRPGNPDIVHIEIWPGIVKDRPVTAPTIPDMAQVRAMVEWFAHLDEEGKLSRFFGRPPLLSHDGARKAVDHEGWIFGAGYHAPTP